MNIPTVIFWNPNHWEIRDSAQPYFDELKEVGIFHETPESAAQHIISVWDDVEYWWSSKTVYKAVQKFCGRFSYTSGEPLKSIYNGLQYK